MHKYMRLIGAVLLVLVLGLTASAFGCRSYSSRALSLSDETAQLYLERRLKHAATLEEAAETMKDLGFSVSLRQVEPAGVSGWYIECYNLVPARRFCDCTIQVEVVMSPEGKPQVRNVRRRLAG